MKRQAMETVNVVETWNKMWSTGILSQGMASKSRRQQEA